MSQVQVIQMKLTDLIPYENNPRINDDAIDVVANSIKEFGFKNPIIIDKDNVIVCGHTRRLAAIKLGLTEVPCIRADDLTEDQIKAFRVADNKTSELSTWDLDKLKIELGDIELNMADFGFEDLLDQMKELPEDDEFDADTELEKEAFVKKGDIWHLGRHKLMCGDSTTSDVQVLMEGKYADLCVTDAPYNVDYEGGSGMKIQNDNMSGEEFYKFLDKAFKNINLSLKPGACFYEFFATREHVNFENALKDNDLNPKQELIWSKNGQFTLGRQDYQWDFEPCFYGWKNGASHNWYSDRKQKCVLTFDKPKRNELHPTQKPVPLISYLMKNSSRPKDLVIDLFGGSGTTLIAAEETDRTCFTMEIDEKYASAIVRRYVKAKGNTDDVFVVRDDQQIKATEIYDFENEKMVDVVN
ncbi:MAG: DNA modification methylase [bacterium]|nr:DNA modification methylase [bacterium]